MYCMHPCCLWYAMTNDRRCSNRYPMHCQCCRGRISNSTRNAILSHVKLCFIHIEWLLSATERTLTLSASSSSVQRRRNGSPRLPLLHFLFHLCSSFPLLNSEAPPPNQLKSSGALLNFRNGSGAKPQPTNNFLCILKPKRAVLVATVCGFS